MEKNKINLFILFIFWNSIYFMLKLANSIQNQILNIGMLLYAVCLIYNLVKGLTSIKKIKSDIIIFFIILFTLYMLSFLNDDTRVFASYGLLDFSPANPLYGIWLFAFPSYVLFRQIKDFNSLLIKCCKTSIFIVIGYCLIYILNLFVIKIDMQYMSYSANLIVPLCFLYFYIKNSKKNIYLMILFYFMLISIIISGSRGAVLVVLIYYVFINVYESKKKLLNLFIISIMFFLLTFYIQDILHLFDNFLKMFNIESRTFDLLKNGSLMVTSGRDLLWTKLFNNINFLKINGLFYERFLLTTDLNNVYYAHNIIFEILTDFGWIVGLIMIFILLFMYIYIYVFSNKQLKNLFFLFFVQGFLLLFISGSFLTSPQFYVLLAIFFSVYEGRKKCI